MTSKYSAMHPHRKHTQFASESAESYAITHDLRNLRTLQSPPISAHTRLARDAANNLAHSGDRGGGRGAVPVFIMAGFIEGFITRHTELPDMLRLGVIFTSLAFIIFYYIYLPNRKKHGITET